MLGVLPKHIFDWKKSILCAWSYVSYPTVCGDDQEVCFRSNSWSEVEQKLPPPVLIPKSSAITIHEGCIYITLQYKHERAVRLLKSNQPSLNNIFQGPCNCGKKRLTALQMWQRMFSAISNHSSPGCRVNVRGEDIHINSQKVFVEAFN